MPVKTISKRFVNSARQAATGLGCPMVERRDSGKRKAGTNSTGGRSGDVGRTADAPKSTASLVGPIGPGEPWEPKTAIHSQPGSVCGEMGAGDIADAEVFDAKALSISVKGPRTAGVWEIPASGDHARSDPGFFDWKASKRFVRQDRHASPLCFERGIRNCRGVGVCDG